MDDVENLILQLTADRGAGKSICPSEAARVLDANWQPRMKQVREAAIRLARAGHLEILRHGKPVPDLDNFRGVIRLRIVASGKKEFSS